MLKKLVSFAFLLSILISGCVKDAANPTDVVTVDITPFNSLLKKVVLIDSGTSQSIEFTYDSLQRLVSTNNTSIFDSSKLPLVNIINIINIKYTYSGNDTLPNTITFTNTYNSVSVPYKNTSVYNITYSPKKIIIKDTGWSISTKSPTIYTFSSDYSYISNLRIKKQTCLNITTGYKEYFSIDSAILDNENVIKYSGNAYYTDNAGNVMYSILSRIVHTISSNYNPLYRFKSNPFFSYQELGNKYFYATKNYVSPNASSNNFITTRSFTVDAYNRVVKIVETSSNGKVTTTTYTYY